MVIAMEDWVRALVPGEPFCHTAPLPDNADEICGSGGGGARQSGSLAVVRDGRIASYQIVAPTTWNFSPRDTAGVPGALEQALVGAPLRDGETSPLAAQHIVRSFDPVWYVPSI